MQGLYYDILRVLPAKQIRNDVVLCYHILRADAVHSLDAIERKFFVFLAIERYVVYDHPLHFVVPLLEDLSVHKNIPLVGESDARTFVDDKLFALYIDDHYVLAQEIVNDDEVVDELQRGEFVVIDIVDRFYFDDVFEVVYATDVDFVVLVSHVDEVEVVVKRLEEELRHRVVVATGELVFYAFQLVRVDFRKFLKERGLLDNVQKRERLADVFRVEFFL